MVRGRYNAKLIGFGFSIVIATMILLAAISIYYLTNTRDVFSRVVSQHNVQLRVMSEFLRLARDRSLTVQHMLLVKDPFELDEHRMKMSEIAQEYLTLREELLDTELNKEEMKIIDDQNRQTNITGRMQNEVADLILNGQQEGAMEVFYDDVIPNQHKAMKLMGKFIALQHMHNSLEMRAISVNIDDDKKVMLILMIFGSVLSIVIASVVTIKINHEISNRSKIEGELEDRVEQRTEKLTYIASHDILTTLPNRGVFNEQLQNSIYQAQRYQKCAALLFLDLDGFKSINDTYGHQAGDHALVEVSNRLKGVIRNSDILARVGGDEFTIILNNINRENEAISVCNKIIEAVNRPITWNNKRCHLGVSIGITFFINDRRDADLLLTEADDAMYVAKAKGKNRYHISKHADREDNVLKFKAPS
ncbi:MAG: diguanylate cyclase [Gammaproteobacteria bacterium]|nr:diguanylate cyclase [Gammaproteobacteria bacterium]